MPGEPWTQDEVAQYLRVHPKTVRKLGVPGAVEIVTTPGARPLVRYDSDVVRQWWADRCAGVQATPARRRARGAPSSAPRLDWVPGARRLA